ncbi:hypothetical protein B484DRAFT_458068 [Ochromonadaceae sp. CCMP2298]|nr:hypothetical protein B484DRAFT_458068 [Ochromonadaceae sp. CCMP2298]
MYVLDKKTTVQKSSAPKKISIQIGTLTTEDIKLASELRVSNREVFQMPLRNAAPFGWTQDWGLATRPRRARRAST